jgi:hypothetical protein
MTSAWSCRSLAIALLLCLCVPTALGNGGPIRDYGGNQIVPLSSDEVQLVRESVKVVIDEENGWVKCRYLLRNLTPEAAQLSIAFVRSQGMTEKNGRDFRAWVGDRPAHIRWLHADLDRWQAYAGGDLDSLPVWDLQIAPGDTLAVRCVYPVRFDNWIDGAFAGEYFTYATKVAALWAGVIESADFEIDLGDCSRYFLCDDYRRPPFIVADIEPPGYRWNGSSLLWRFENWEPSKDIVVGIRKALALHWQEFLEGRISGGLGWYPIELPRYAGDSVLYADVPTLEAIRDAFGRQSAAEPIAGNYEGFAHAYLEVLRLEIAARHGAPFEDGSATEFFRSQRWYAADSSYTRSRLNATERANEEVLLDLQRRVADTPQLLLPLPAQR